MDNKKALEVVGTLLVRDQQAGKVREVDYTELDAPSDIPNRLVCLRADPSDSRCTPETTKHKCELCGTAVLIVPTTEEFIQREGNVQIACIVCVAEQYEKGDVPQQVGRVTEALEHIKKRVLN